MYGTTLQGPPTDGRAWDGEGGYRVFRGGSWANAPASGCAFRTRGVPGSRDDYLGFRLVLATRVKEDIRPFS